MNPITYQAFLDEFVKIAKFSPKEFSRLSNFVRSTASKYRIPASRVPGQAGFTTAAMRKGPVVARAEQAGVRKAEELSRLLQEGKITREEAISRLKMNKPDITLRTVSDTVPGAPGVSGTATAIKPKAPFEPIPVSPPPNTVRPSPITAPSVPLQPTLDRTADTVKKLPSRWKRVLMGGGIGTAGFGGGLSLDEDFALV